MIGEFLLMFILILDFIQGMLGHEKASTTQIYASLRGERRRELYKRFF
jgi:integrase/recombinase XerD